jgi:hypothetical protein
MNTVLCENHDVRMDTSQIILKSDNIPGLYKQTKARYNMKCTYLIICSFLMVSLTTSPVETTSDAHPAWSSSNILGCTKQSFVAKRGS